MSDKGFEADVKIAEHQVAQRTGLPKDVVREAVKATAEQIGDGTVLGNLTAEEMAQKALIENSQLGEKKD